MSSSKRKIYVLDTSVLLHDPNTLFSFENNEIVLPIIVLDEVDKFKKGSEEVNRNARLAIKSIDSLRTAGDIEKGVPLGEDGILKIAVKLSSNNLLPRGFSENNDNLIIATALEVKKTHPRRKVVLVSKDINMRVKAQALGLNSEDYRADKINLEELYTGQEICEVTDEELGLFYKDREIDLIENIFYYPNQYVYLKSPSGKKALGRYCDNKKKITLLRDLKYDVFGIKPLNKEQRFAMDLLLDDKILLVTMVGKAGTGKTIIALAAGLQKVLNEKIYRKMSVYRPLIPMGRDIGYLPGKQEDKLSPWMHPIFDNLELFLTEATLGKKVKAETRLQGLLDTGVLEISALTFIRGRSLPYQYLIIDEAQNLTPHEAKTIITRAGEGTKIILTGDAYQIDHPYLDSTSNGLTFIIDKFKEQEIAGHITLSKGERSPLAELASNIL